MKPLVDTLPFMRFLFAAPADNDRSPRYMEKALAAIHQSLAAGQTLRLEYAVDEQRLGLAIELPGDIEGAVIGPLRANYPRASLEPHSAGHHSVAYSHCLNVSLVPDLFPILRHGQFEDLLNRSYADPIDSLLQSQRPDEAVECRLVLEVSPAAATRLDRSASDHSRGTIVFHAAHTNRRVVSSP